MLEGHGRIYVAKRAPKKPKENKAGDKEQSTTDAEKGQAEGSTEKDGTDKSHSEKDNPEKGDVNMTEAEKDTAHDKDADKDKIHAEKPEAPEVPEPSKVPLDNDMDKDDAEPESNEGMLCFLAFQY